MHAKTIKRSPLRTSMHFCYPVHDFGRVSSVTFQTARLLTRSEILSIDSLLVSRADPDTTDVPPPC